MAKRAQNARPPRRPQAPNPYTSKIVKPPTKQHLRDTLRHAVSHRDNDAYEDYDEWDFK